jgi:anti-anti-sigma regulatory factor
MLTRDQTEGAETVAVKQCHTCEAELLVRDKFCRRCGVRQTNGGATSTDQMYWSGGETRLLAGSAGGYLTFSLAGRLAGEWTQELERCWREAAAARQSQSVAVDLTEVTFVDDAGKRLLAAMARAGVELIAADVLLKALVEQIALGVSFDEDASLAGAK